MMELSLPQESTNINIYWGSAFSMFRALFCHCKLILQGDQVGTESQKREGISRQNTRQRILGASWDPSLFMLLPLWWLHLELSGTWVSTVLGRKPGGLRLVLMRASFTGIPSKPLPLFPPLWKGEVILCLLLRFTTIKRDVCFGVVQMQDIHKDSR